MSNAKNTSPSATSTHLTDPCRDDGFTTAMGSLFQGCTNLLWNMFFLIPNLNVQLEVQLEAISSCPVPCNMEEQTNPHLGYTILSGSSDIKWHLPSPRLQFHPTPAPGNADRHLSLHSVSLQQLADKWRNGSSRAESTDSPELLPHRDLTHLGTESRQTNRRTAQVCTGLTSEAYLGCKNTRKYKTFYLALHTFRTQIILFYQYSTKC